MSQKEKQYYSFSTHEGAKNLGFMVSDELHTRILSLCNILEMSRSSLLRFLLTRGVDDLEAKLVERVEKLEKKQV